LVFIFEGAALFIAAPIHCTLSFENSASLPSLFGDFILLRSDRFKPRNFALATAFYLEHAQRIRTQSTFTVLPSASFLKSPVSPYPACLFATRVPLAKSPVLFAVLTSFFWNRLFGFLSFPSQIIGSLLPPYRTGFP